MKTTSEIRQDFLDFFQSKGHEIVPSSSLVPGNDPTLLFTNAGMVQFKDVFLGAEKRSYMRAASSQRCVRAGGKHNDLDQVGYTARHHTFFEMLGNFSFGDYFKREAIQYAWELLTVVWKIPQQKLLVTVYHTDDETFDIWNKEIGLPTERIIRIGDKPGGGSDNFWQMADTGPCGPCTEIFYDHGPEIAGGPPGSPDEDGDRFIEIWNLVFMQFDRSAEGTLTPLPAPCVDTGMGLERIAAVLQHVHSNYEIDLFQHLIKAAAEITDVRKVNSLLPLAGEGAQRADEGGSSKLNSPHPNPLPRGEGKKTDDLVEKSLRVIADHIRACAFLIADGVLPSNEGRGYVLKSIINRALRHGWKENPSNLFFYQMVKPLIEVMGGAYPSLISQRETIERTLKIEETRFRETFIRGKDYFQEAITPEHRGLNAWIANNRFKLVGYFRSGIAQDLNHPPKYEQGRICGVFEEGTESYSAESLYIPIVSENTLDDLYGKINEPRYKDANKHTVVITEENISDDQKKRFGAKVTFYTNLDVNFITGHVAFFLHDTYGFTNDKTMNFALEKGLEVDLTGCELGDH